MNIVVNDIALPLAQKMQEKFGIPYVYFNKFVIPEKIYEAYKNLFVYLDLELPGELEGLYQNAREKIEKTRVNWRVLLIFTGIRRMQFLK